MRRAFVLFLLFVTGGICFAQSLPNCSPVGTWYGGSDTKYLLTIIPITGERFAVRAEVVMDIASVGDPAWTSWSGQFIRVASNHYVGQYISMYSTSIEVPPPPESYELDGVRGHLSFTDCDHVKINYEKYLIYFDLTKVVFVDAPDLMFDISDLVENYTRMPMTCPVCAMLSEPAKLRKK